MYMYKAVAPDSYTLVFTFPRHIGSPRNTHLGQSFRSFFLWSPLMCAFPLRDIPFCLCPRNQCVLQSYSHPMCAHPFHLSFRLSLCDISPSYQRTHTCMC